MQSKNALPTKLDPSSVVCIVDTREQLPLDLAPLRTEVGTLATGDYSIHGLEHLVCIERKSLDDMLGCVGRERERAAMGIQVELVGDHDRAGRFASRLLYTVARRRFAELRSMFPQCEASR